VIETESASHARGAFVPAPVEGRRLEFSDVITSIGDPRVVLCNTLPVESFLQETMPGSVSLPYTETYAEDNFPLLRSRHELGAAFADRGITHRHHLICFCGIGYSAAQVYFAARYAGFPQVSLYDGSMVDWSARGGELVPGSP
jgi:thiosulfate/3-mercaptopyruvate sulfurtransferase